MTAARRAWIALAAVALVAAVAWAGVRLRAAVWQQTTPIRFKFDIQNGFKWGNYARDVGYLNVYESVGPPSDRRSQLDYAPLRLGLMTAWVDWLDRNDLLAQGWQNDRAFHAPLLTFNAAMEGLAAVAAALLAWHVRRRVAGTSAASAGALAGAAALLVWFNPASLYEAHAWPQWDVWPMPFFLFAVYFGLHRRWLTAGLLVGVASMLKGQILAVGWVLPVWAICLGDWRGALRLVGGACAAILLTGLPWIVSSYDALTQTRDVHTPAVALIVLATLAAALLPRKFSPGVVCAALVVSLYVAMRFLGGTDYWLQYALSVGTYNYPTMAMGPTSNLPAILRDRYGWHDVHAPLFTWPALQWIDKDGVEQFRVGGLITMRTLLLMLFGAFSLSCGIRAASLDRRGDPRVLLALSLPWLFFFLVPCQIHERYLLFVSVCAAVWVVCGVGITLLGILIMLISLVHLVFTMLLANRVDRVGLAGRVESPWGFLRTLLEPTQPGIAWMLMLIALILFYTLFTRRPRMEPMHDIV